MKKNTKGIWHEDMKNQPNAIHKVKSRKYSKEWKSKTTDEVRRTMQIRPKHGPHQKPWVDSGAP